MCNDLIKYKYVIDIAIKVKCASMKVNECVKNVMRQNVSCVHVMCHASKMNASMNASKMSIKVKLLNCLLYSGLFCPTFILLGINKTILLERNTSEEQRTITSGNNDKSD